MKKLLYVLMLILICTLSILCTTSVSFADGLISHSMSATISKYVGNDNYHYSGCHTCTGVTHLVTSYVFGIGWNNGDHTNNDRTVWKRIDTYQGSTEGDIVAWICSTAKPGDVLTNGFGAIGSSKHTAMITEVGSGNYKEIDEYGASGGYRLYLGTSMSNKVNQTLYLYRFQGYSGSTVKASVISEIKDFWYEPNIMHVHNESAYAKDTTNDIPDTDYMRIPAGSAVTVLTGINNYSDYYYICYNSIYGYVKKSFISLEPIKFTPPSIAIENATDITSNSAVVRGSVTYVNPYRPTVEHLYYGTANNEGSMTKWGTDDISKYTSFHWTLSGLLPNTTYYYQFRVETANGSEIVTTKSDIKQFKTTAGGTAGDPTTPAEIKAAVYKYLTNDMRLNQAAACGIMANIQKESSFVVTTASTESDGDVSYGICQWKGSRRTNLETYCNNNGYHANTLDGQLHFLEYELKNSYTSLFNTLKSTPNTAQGAYDAAFLWVTEFERPKYQGFSGKDRGTLAATTYWNTYGTGTDNTYWQDGNFSRFRILNASSTSNIQLEAYLPVNNYTNTKFQPSKVGVKFGTTASSLTELSSDATAVDSGRYYYSLAKYYNGTLVSGTKYYFQFYYIAGGKTYNSKVYEFTFGSSSFTVADTSATVTVVEPKITINNVTSVTENSANVSGSFTYTAPFQPTTVRLYYGTASSESNLREWGSSNISNNTTFQWTLSGLNSNTTYYYQFRTEFTYNGTKYTTKSAIKSFTTSKPAAVTETWNYTAPSISVNSASSITASGAYVSCSIGYTSNSKPTYEKLYYGTTNNESSMTLYGSDNLSSLTVNPISCHWTMTGLSANSTYYYQFRAETTVTGSLGTVKTYTEKSPVYSFKTLSSTETWAHTAPSIRVYDPTNITTNLIAVAARIEPFKKVGNVVTYGHYEQDNNKNNGEEPIEWIVLDVQGNKVLLISKYGLDAQPYNTEYKDITWEKCTLRSWLNSTFLDAAFTAEEQKGILTTAVDNSKAQGYSGWSTNGGNNTQDKIFLLSYAEANKYFGVQHYSVVGADQNTASRVAPTAYAIGQGAYSDSYYKTSEGKAVGIWWLRSPGDSQDLAAYVIADGSLYDIDVDFSDWAVRPAFWLDLDKCVIENADAGLFGVGSAEENSGNMKKPEEAGAKEGRSAFMTVGNVVTFGNYEQDNNKNNGKEPIEWIVLDVQGNKVLLISKYGLDAQPYNTEWTDITWETCTLRSWLNSTFLNAAFTAEEQKGILTTAVDNSKAQGYSDWDTDGGNNTQDKIFLLSYAEANKYFGVQLYSVDGAEQNTASRVVPTAYAIAQGASTSSRCKTSEGKAAGYWWLRSPGDDQNYAARVNTDGSLSSLYVSFSNKAVRPAFWLDLDKCVIENADAGLPGIGSAEENSGNMKKPEEAGAKEGRSAFMTVGNVVTFGNYEQDNDTVNGEEPIEWIVLDVQGNKALLISKYGLDAQPYNTEDKSITWEKCTLRSWLNSTFLNAAFTAEEQKGILTTAVDNSKAQGYRKWSTDGGNNTKDKIFLLSYAEANKYFKVTYSDSNNTASRVAPTAYAIAQGAYTNSSRKTSEGKAAGYWWLRSPGDGQYDAAYLSTGGSLCSSGVFISNEAVRPAFWLDLESGIF